MQFFNAFDASEPQRFLTDALLGIESEYGLNITIHDHCGLLFDRDGRSLLPRRDFHVQEFCRMKRFDVRNWNRNCLQSCAFEAEQLALKNFRPFIHHCWKGCCELVVPVERGGELVLILYAGVFREKGKEPPEFLPQDVASEYRKLPQFSLKKMRALAPVLFLFAQGLLCCAERVRSEKGSGVDVRKLMILEFLHTNAHRERVKLEDLAKVLCVSPSRTSHLVSELFGQPFQMLLLSERMTRARNLLVSGMQPIKEIAETVGMSNVFYFNRMFKKFYEMPPGRFRKTSGAIFQGEK